MSARERQRHRRMWRRAHPFVPWDAARLVRTFGYLGRTDLVEAAIVRATRKESPDDAMVLA